MNLMRVHILNMILKIVLTSDETFVALCAIKNIKARFYNIEHLAHKELNRLLSLESELAKINCSFTKTDDVWILIPSDFDKSKTIEINTHNDHRIAYGICITCSCMQRSDIR